MLIEELPGVTYPFRKALLVNRLNPSKQPVWFESIRGYLHGLRIKLLARCGYGVVIVGGCGRGKTFILNKAFPGKIVQPKREFLTPGKRMPLDVATLPDGLCAVDEVSSYDWAKTRPFFPDLRGRKVVFAVQSVGQLLEAGLADLLQERLLIVFLGTRDELREQCRFSNAPTQFRLSVLGQKMQHF